LYDRLDDDTFKYIERPENPKGRIVVTDLPDLLDDTFISGEIYVNRGDSPGWINPLAANNYLDCERLYINTPSPNCNDTLSITDRQSASAHALRFLRGTNSLATLCDGCLISDGTGRYCHYGSLKQLRDNYFIPPFAWPNIPYTVGKIFINSDEGMVRLLKAPKGSNIRDYSKQPRLLSEHRVHILDPNVDTWISTIDKLRADSKDPFGLVISSTIQIKHVGNSASLIGSVLCKYDGSVCWSTDWIPGYVKLLMAHIPCS
jgi:hypothetical protein